MASIVNNDGNHRIATDIYTRTVIHLRNTWLRHGGNVHGSLGVRGKFELEVPWQHVCMVVVYLWPVYTVDREAVSRAEGPGAAARSCFDLYGVDLLLGVLHRICSTSLRRLPVGLHAVRGRFYGTCYT